MRKRIIRFCAILVILCLALPTFAFASTKSSTYIAYTNAWFERSGNDVNIYYTIVGRHIMNEIGVSEILLYEKNGNVWSKVYTFDSDNSAYTTDMLSYNTSAMGDHVTYAGLASKDYLAILYYYAADDDGSDTIPYYAYS